MKLKDSGCAAVPRAARGTTSPSLCFFNQHICPVLTSCANCNGKAASNLNFSQQLGETASVGMLHLVKFAGAVELGGAADMQ